MKIAYINPAPLMREYESFNALIKKNTRIMGRNGTKVDIKWCKKGYSDPDYVFSEAYNKIQIVKEVYEAEKNGYDAAIVGCFLDPGLIEARSIVNIPISGACESAVLLASCLGAKFSIILMSPQTGPYQEEYIKNISPKLVSVKKWELQVPEAVASVYADPKKLINEFKKLAEKAIKDDNAEVIIPACTIVATVLTAKKEYNIKGVPIVDPVVASVKMAEILVDLRNKYGTGVCRSTIYNPGSHILREIPIEEW
jgi:allantoin racemase